MQNPQDDPKGFVARRAQQLNDRLSKAIADRRKSAALQYVTNDPYKTHFKEKGERLERTIGRLQKQTDE